MNTVKLICLDIDRTLIDDSRTIPEENLKAVRAAHGKKGVHIAVNSGRIASSARSFMKAMGVREAFPSLGGCVVQNWDGSIIEEHFIDRGAASEINALARKLGCALFLYTGDRWHLDPGYPFWQDSETRATGLEGNITDTARLLKTHSPNKMLAADMDAEKINRLRDEVRASFSGSVDCFKSNDLYLEIVPAGINKGTAVDALCRHYGIGRESVMSIGDYYNDIDMFSASGIAVAMADSPAEVKEAATFVTQADCNGCGVAEAIRRFVLDV